MRQDFESKSTKSNHWVKIKAIAFCEIRNMLHPATGVVLKSEPGHVLHPKEDC